jgi:hypothetical protein
MYQNGQALEQVESEFLLIFNLFNEFFFGEVSGLF